jgi:hypothetical protein
MRRYVRHRKRELGRGTRATGVPPNYVSGQVDWYEARVELNGKPVLLQMFAMLLRCTKFHAPHNFSGS